jgi:hypothetical protein
VLASGGALKPIGPYGAAAKDTQLEQLRLRAYYPTHKSVDTPTLTQGTILHTRFPVLLMIPDKGKQAHAYEELIIQLVSHGYIVIAINNAFDGRIMDNLLRVRKALESNGTDLAELASHAQIDHVGLLGCATAAKITATAAQDYPELFTAGATIDVNTTYSIHQPTYDKTPFLQLLESNPSKKKLALPSNNYVIQLNSNDNDQLQDYYVLQFFDMYLKGVTSYCLAHCMPVSKDSLIKCGGYKIRIHKLTSSNMPQGVHQHNKKPFLGRILS